MKNNTIWFGVRMLLESIHPEEPAAKRVFEDRIIVVRAQTELEARRKGEKMGKRAKQEYRNVAGKKVLWVFREIMDVAPLPWQETIEDGSEVYYAFVSQRGLRHLRQTLQSIED